MCVSVCVCAVVLSYVFEQVSVCMCLWDCAAKRSVPVCSHGLVASSACDIS